jgi:epoxyqueuosine reductase
MARAAGFEVARVTRPDAIPLAGTRLEEFLALRRHGTMDWMERNADRRAAPHVLWPQACAILMVGMNYGPAHDPRADLARTDHGLISVYARGEDYHDLMKKRLKALARAFHAETGEDVKVFVDTAPLMEKPLAEAAGIGWQGKHTNLVSREFGAWLFLGAIATTAELPPDDPERDHCGSCRRCLDVCPTNAFPAPYQLDARRCISYLTIEHKGQIPPALRAPIGNRIYGCDDCLAACPWNKFASRAREMAYVARAATDPTPLPELARLDDAAFRERFRKNPVKRIGRDRFVRNVLVAIGNSGDEALADAALERIDDESPLVRGMAAWALSRLLPPAAFAALRDRYFADEPDESVRAEWQGRAA